MRPYVHSPYTHNARRRPAGSGLSPRTLLIIGICLISLSTIGLVKTIWENHNLDQWTTELNKEYAIANEENTKLKEDLNYMGSLNYHDKKAKETLNMKEPGETVITIKGIEAGNTKLSDFKPKAPPTPVPPNYVQWYNVFFGKEQVKF
ncbi:MAG: septum formation initiator family protein [bacterium]